ncbi:Uncharacterized protein BP5553_02210 [Venustampulla echinocandica]|uniref:AB hydrolase-1 domain-containing protein n=1 Tax=Venustampulla echinocandica TaxID=2656787 RepID=A0A370U370_9HELO|nr:Uncharacterized protein BP5553_02210 [Venustampulla echinocandica]RDL42231.1 Uncharacterized protein BP5553_02210 [Venustampulla echinocandica]
MPIIQEVQFRTVDGLTLHGNLYPAEERGPAVVLTPGFACVKEMFVPDVAEAFQAANITALTYDPRNTGASEGEPRQDIDPLAQASDYSDALTFLSQQPTVDPNQISFWGFSFAGMVSLTAAALDRRARQVIAVCPLTDFGFSGKREKVLAKITKDRESQVAGNVPFCVPVLTSKGENPAGFGGNPEAEDYGKILNAHQVAPSYKNSTTLQTYYKIARWQPFGLVKSVAPTPALIVTSADDRISTAKNQGKLVDSIDGPKKWHVEPNKGHMDILSGESFPKLMKLQVDFLKGA